MLRQWFSEHHLYDEKWQFPDSFIDILFLVAFRLLLTAVFGCSLTYS